VRYQNIYLLRDLLIELRQAILIRHEMPVHEGRRPWGTVEGYAIDQQWLILEDVYRFSEDFSDLVRRGLKAFIMISSNNDRVTRPRLSLHLLSEPVGELCSLFQQSPARDIACVNEDITRGDAPAPPAICVADRSYLQIVLPLQIVALRLRD
jgi:hypothetical protein